MTVRMLRQALFELPDQEAEVTIALPIGLDASTLGRRHNFVLGTSVPELKNLVLGAHGIYLIGEAEDLNDDPDPDCAWLSIGRRKV